MLVGATYINTMAGASYTGVCTVGFSAIMAVVSFFCSLPRTFDTLAKLATASAFFTFISVMLAAIFAGIEAHPAGYNTGGPKGLLVGEPTVLVVPAAGTTFVSGMNAFLNISYTFVRFSAAILSSVGLPHNQACCLGSILLNRHVS